MTEERTRPSKHSLLPLITVVVLTLCAGPAAAKGKGSLTLSQAIRMARQNNLQLKSAKAGVASAQERKKGAWSALGPHLSASAGLSFLGGDSAFSQASGGSTSTTTTSGALNMGEIMNADSLKLSLGVSWALFDAKSVSSALNAGIAARSTRASSANLTADVLTRTTMAFYDLLAAEEYLHIARQTADATASHLTRTRNMREAGAATKADELRWQAQHAADKQKVVTAAQQLANARLQLNNLLGRPLHAALTLAAPAGAGKEQPAPKKATLSSSHPQLQLAALNVEARKQDKRTAGAAFLPTLSATAGYSWQTFLPYEEAMADAGWLGSWTAGLTLTLPIFDSASKIFELRRAGQEVKKARLEADNTRRTVEQQLAQANLDVRARHQNLASAREQLQSAEAASKSADDLYRAGAATTTDVLDAEKSLSQARYNQSFARYSYLSALSLRDQAAGRVRVSQ